MFDATRARALVLAPVLAASLAATGCATGSGPDRGVRAVEASREAVVAGVEAGVEGSEALAPFDVPVRYNPARCDCPDYEVRIRGRWLRAYIEGDEELMTRLERFSARAEDDPQAQMVLRGWLTADTRRSSREVSYQVFEAE